MNIFSWSEIFNNPQNYSQFFSKGSGISIGSFDGIHLGHQKLLSTLVQKCKEENLLSGLVTFSRPLPSIKHSKDYNGDITTLKQRIEIFEKLQINFIIIVDFDSNFASRSGTQFLDLLIQFCNLKFLAEGIDFRCGYKGATDTQAIRYWAEQNKINTTFVDPVFYREGTDEEERISSSYIRQMILKGFFTTVSELLNKHFELDFSEVDEEEGELLKEKIIQVIPSEGVYLCKNENNDDVRVQITESKIVLSKKSKKIIF